MAFKCIKLNSNWEPIEIISWWRACNLTHFCEIPKADILWSYPDTDKIRSKYNEWNYPAIIVLKAFSKRRKPRIASPGLKAILIRDMYKCAYCGCHLTNASGTRDHVIPESRGGPTSWTNLVAACKKCQQRKADKMCKECNMFPNWEPKEPLFSERFLNSFRISSSDERRIWKAGFKKLGLTYLLERDKNESVIFNSSGE